MKNKLTDLNDHLFAELERLGDEELKGTALTEELSRSHGIGEIATQIVNNGNLLLKAHIASVEWAPMTSKKCLPVILE